MSSGSMRCWWMGRARLLFGSEGTPRRFLNVTRARLSVPVFFCAGGSRRDGHPRCSIPSQFGWEASDQQLGTGFGGREILINRLRTAYILLVLTLGETSEEGDRVG